MGDTGLEHAPLTPSKTPISENERAESGAHNDRDAPEDPDLAFILDQWPSLPEKTRRSIMALVRSTAGKEQSR